MLPLVYSLSKDLPGMWSDKLLDREAEPCPSSCNDKTLPPVADVCPETGPNKELSIPSLQQTNGKQDQALFDPI